MHALLIGYMFLFIHRPFEVWPWLGDLHIERVYVLGTLAVWSVWPGKRWLPNGLHLAFALFATTVLLAWGASPWADHGQRIVEDYFKVIVFYVLLVTSVHDERGLKRLLTAFVAIMGIYMAHSLREYMGGRHTYRMGIPRMIGVDSTLGDPNSFGASIVYALPIALVLWRIGIGGRTGRLLLLGYFGLSVLCILLTGSRGSLLALIAFGGILGLQIRRAWLWGIVALALAPGVFVALPESLQNRFETIVNPEAGPKEAQTSGEGRIEGLLMGFELWAANPVTGIGPGAWIPATGSSVESHSLYGQLVGELGTFGLMGFLAVLGMFLVNFRLMKRIRTEYPEWNGDLIFQLTRSVGMTLFLLLLLGFAGHNLFRFTWLWYGGFLIIAVHCARRRMLDPEAWLPEVEEEYDEPTTLPEGWVEHDGHTNAQAY